MRQVQVNFGITDLALSAEKSSIRIKYKLCKTKHLTHSVGLGERSSNPMNNSLKHRL